MGTEQCMETQHLCPASPSRGGLSGLAGVTTRPARYPSGGVPPAVDRQLHLLTTTRGEHSKKLNIDDLAPWDLPYKGARVFVKFWRYSLPLVKFQLRITLGSTGKLAVVLSRL